MDQCHQVHIVIIDQLLWYMLSNSIIDAAQKKIIGSHCIGTSVPI